MIGMSSSSARTTIMIGVSGFSPNKTLDSTTTSMMAIVIMTR